VPYTLAELTTTTTGGSPYGASHVSWNRQPSQLSKDEKVIAKTLGQRVAQIALKLG
jgi:NAD(P)H dehydrogenase (quinone)